MRKYRIGILSIDNPFDRRASSGTRYMMVDQLCHRGHDVVWIKITRPKMYVWRFFLFCASKISGEDYLFHKTTRLCSKYIKTADKKLLETCDILMVAFFSGVCQGLTVNKKILYFSDSTFNLLDGYYLKHLSMC